MSDDFKYEHEDEMTGEEVEKAIAITVEAQKGQVHIMGPVPSPRLSVAEDKLVDYIDSIMGMRARGKGVGPEYAARMLIDSHAKQAVVLKQQRSQIESLNNMLQGVRYLQKLSSWRRFLIRWLSKGNLLF